MFYYTTISGYVQYAYIIHTIQCLSVTILDTGLPKNNIIDTGLPI